jgi:hypothetical protein
LKAIVTPQQINDHLDALRLTPANAAQLLGVSARTVRRWLDGEEPPGPAQAALQAWRVLDAHHLPWKPDSISIFENDRDQIERHRHHAQALAAMIESVNARGGPEHRWSVDLPRRVATFGPFEVDFYHLLNGGFSIAAYRRLGPDGSNVERDKPYVEDAAFCIAEAFAKAAQAGEALTAVAEYVRQHSAVSAWRGPRLPSADEKDRCQRQIMTQADKLESLAKDATEGRATYVQFEAILRELHMLGFFPEISLISAVAHAMA